MKDKTFRDMNLEDFAICFRNALNDGESVSDDSVKECHRMYLRGRGNTSGCPSRNFREKIEIDYCCHKCSDCWNMCLNHTFDKENLGGFWHV
ncbi:MAG: hypothetical protein ACRCX2_28275 [Paraclostridium sp.]